MVIVGTTGGSGGFLIVHSNSCMMGKCPGTSAETDFFPFCLTLFCFQSQTAAWFLFSSHPSSLLRAVVTLLFDLIECVELP